MKPNNPQHPGSGNETQPSLQVMDIIHGFLPTQVVHVTAKLNIADLIAEGTITADGLAKATATNPHALYRLGVV